MKTLEIKKAGKVFSMMSKSQTIGIKAIAEQVYESGDGQLIATFPNATVKGSSKVLVMIYENSIILYIHKTFKKIAYKFTMDEVEITSVQNKGVKALFKGKSWVKLVSPQMQAGDKPLQFSIGMIMYRDGIRYVTPNSKATTKLGFLMQNIQKVTLSNKGDDFIKTDVVLVSENAKGKLSLKAPLNLGCQDYLLLYENKGYLVNDEILEFSSKDISRTESFEFKQIFLKVNLLDIQLKGGKEMKLGMYTQGTISKESANELKDLFNSWTD